MTELLRPYADLDGIFEKIEYRSSLSQPFQPVEFASDAATCMVKVDDLRIIPQHQFRVSLREDAFNPKYAKHKSNLRFLIIARDTVLRRELKLADYQINEIPSTVSLNREDLRATSLAFRDSLVLWFVVIADALIKGDPAFPTQRASRLAELRIQLRNSAGGASFPFKRATAEEFAQIGWPPESGLYLEVGDPSDLIAEDTTSVQNAISVWVHEKVWTAIQNDPSTLRLSMVTISAAYLILGAVIPLIRHGSKVPEMSIVGQLIAHLEKQASQPEGHLRKEFENAGSVHVLDAYIQNAWKFVASAGKFDEQELPQ